jgi:selenide,water dikinase
MDDAAVVRWAPSADASERYVVQTIDFITPVVDDPYTWGGVAAANALSDVYAMGGTPRFALAVVGFPSDVLPVGVLEQVLAGGAAKAREASTPIVGGHSVRDAEPKYGLVVTGEVAPDRLVTNAGARAGDVLVLTKPLGTGLMVGALRAETLPADGERELTASMLTLNAGAARAMHEIGVHAATDVSGFGLLGHLMQLLSASGVAADVRGADVPTLPGVPALAREAGMGGAAKRNRAYVGSRAHGSVPEHVERILVDPQTSGGLLIAVPAARADALVAALQREGTPCAAIIGTVREGEPGAIELG